jgi:hypothetical protein
MKLKIFIAIFLLTMIGLIAYSSVTKNAFAPAEYLPREALIYVQTDDLPQLIKIWNESKIKEKYLGSQNFADFQNHHLGRKLNSRWSEFEKAAGFQTDLQTISGLAEKQAAVAIYDIGKLEFVFIAPMSKEIFTATRFLQNQDNFTEEAIDDETVVYRVAVEADRGRQKQELIFTYLKGHFVLATSEKLLAQTMANLKDKSHKNRLLDESSFSALQSQIEPHTATVWVNQTALNDDYYFKHYWLMSDAKDLKNIRAGIFDFEIGDGKLIEHRKFLLSETPNISSISSAQAEQALSLVPENVPFYQLKTATSQTINESVQKTISEKREDPMPHRSKRDYEYSDYDNYKSDWHDYEYLDNVFDQNIDESEENETVERQSVKVDFFQSLQSANPSAIVHFTVPNILPAPMFIEFKQASIFNLSAPQKFNQNAFESEIEKSLAAQVMILSPEAKLLWETKSEDNLTWRELNLPIIGWNVSYVIRGNNLILTNNSEFLQEILATQNSPKMEKSISGFNEFTVLNLEQRENSFDQVFEEIANKNIADDFFTENISSLLDSISEVKRIELTRKISKNLMEERITAILKEAEIK